MKVLIIGGTGNISTACTEEVLKKGYEVFHFNRGLSPSPFNKELITIQGDINSAEDRKNILKYGAFDAVINFVCFTPRQIQNDIEFFTGRTSQYIFISSATVYQKPPLHYMITEDTPLGNPFWKYAQDKIACENLLTGQTRLPYTIVRPSYTYDKTWIPTALTARLYTPVYRIKKGLPWISHGDGESLWVMTHASDFAVAFTALLGESKALNRAFHITSDEVHTWDNLYRIIGEVSGKEPLLVHIPSDFIFATDPSWGEALLGDKARSMIFDNSAIRKIIPDWKAIKTFKEGIRESIAWFEKESTRMEIDPEVENRLNNLLTKFSNTNLSQK